MAHITIYNNLITGLQERGYDINISGDNTKELIWSGESWERFTEETGFDESHVGGLILLADGVTFDQNKQNNNVPKPTAQGADLVEYLESQFIGQSWTDRKALQQLFVMTGVKTLLESQTCNPLSDSDYNSFLLDIGQQVSLSEEQKEMMSGMAHAWSQTVRLVQEAQT